jgi:galactose mutarotase-like enzyme
MFLEFIVIMAKNYTLLSPDKRSIIQISDLGAQILSYRINNEPIFFENQFNQKRCGMPILFPFAGPLYENKLTLTKTKLPQHGFGRDVEWQIYQTLEKPEYNVISFALSYSDLPEIWQNNFPFPFITMVHYYLSNDSLDIDLVVMNPLQEDMQIPVRPGFHPYFCATMEEKKSLKASQNQPLINKINWDSIREPIFLSPLENKFKIHLGSKKIIMNIKERIFRLSDETFEIDLDTNNKVVIWSEPDSEFICVEPISGPFNSINYNPILVQKGQGYQFRVKIEITF